MADNVSLSKPGTLLHGFSVGGNDLPGDMAIALSAIELECRRVLENEDYNSFTRLTLPASQQIDLGGAGLVIYRLADRVVWGTDYDEINGSERQMGSQKTLDVYMDQLLSIDFTFPRNDMKRLRDSSKSEDERTELAQDLAAHWIASFITNRLMQLELIHLRAIRDYYLWRYQYDKKSVLVIDPKSIVDSQSAENAFYAIGEKMVEKTTEITKNEVGTNDDDWRVFFGPYTWLKITRVYQKIVAGTTPIAAETLATGALYRDQILGTDVQKHIYLENSFIAGTESGMNKDISFNFKGFIGFAQHRENEAYPMSFDFLNTLIDPPTQNIRMVGRVMFGLPAFTRGNLGFIIMDHEPTAQEIANATANIKPMETSGRGNYKDNLKYSFQLTQTDQALANKFTTDGKLIMKLNLAKGTNFIIPQAQFQLNISPSTHIFIYNANPNWKAGQEVKKVDGGKGWSELATTKWEDLKAGSDVFMACGSFKGGDATNGDFIVEKVQEVIVANSTASLG